ncbi:MAG TPA: glycosyltransferase family 39 protein [Rhizomicrobium sp.]|jgi:4-amino-4-deoxy-L-arabinose transferase-like glycosyltransferase|nr:glycosyltransferase family 39 protein [Rhizomicrobium sp.]
MADRTLALTGPAGSWLEQAARRPVLVILFVALFGWISGVILLPATDRDESRFAEASRQMVETGNYVDIRFANTPRYNKPAGIYWLQATSAELWGPAYRGRIWVYRLPSLLGGFLSLLFLYTLARSIAPPATALLASLLLGTTLLLSIESTIATTDAALLATVIAAQAALMRVYLAARGHARSSRIFILAGWAAMGAGILIKGPVILIVVGATAFAVSLWDRDWRWLRGTRPVVGAALALALVAPWASAIALASHGAFYQQSLGHDFAAKIFGGEESHGAPPGYYLALASFTFWPATLLLLPAIGHAIRGRKNPAIRFLLAWSGAVWLLFELVPTKLPHYILPAYPALALLAALWATGAHAEGEGRWSRVLRYAAGVQFAIALIALTAAGVVLPERLGGAADPLLLVGTAAIFVAGCAAIFLLFQRRPLSAAGAGMISALLFNILLAWKVAPQLHAIWLSSRAAELVAAERGPEHTPVVLDGYVEPSLVFLLGSNTRVEPAGEAGEAAEETGLALVENRVARLFLSDLRRRGDAVIALGHVSGLDYSTGRAQHITLYRVTRPRAGTSKT